MMSRPASLGACAARIATGATGAGTTDGSHRCRGATAMSRIRRWPASLEAADAEVCSVTGTRQLEHQPQGRAAHARCARDDGAAARGQLGLQHERAADRRPRGPACRAANTLCWPARTARAPRVCRHRWPRDAHVADSAATSRRPATARRDASSVSQTANRYPQKILLHHGVQRLICDAIYLVAVDSFNPLRCDAPSCARSKTRICRSAAAAGRPCSHAPAIRSARGTRSGDSQRDPDARSSSGRCSRYRSRCTTCTAGSSYISQQRVGRAA